MKLTKIDLVQSPDSQGKIRLIGEVHYFDSTEPEYYWFEVDQKYRAQVSTSGNLWLVLLLPLAVTLGEPLEICAPVDPRLLRNMHEVMRIWRSWYPELQSVPIKARTRKNVLHGKRKVASFFSGGVDSFSTVLRYEKALNKNTPYEISDLINVWGFDVPLKNHNAYSMMRESYLKAAGKLHKNLIDIKTNVRELRWKQANWAFLSHSCALVSVALLLEKRFQKVLIASTGGYHDLQPWASHVLIDPKLSSTNLEIVHDGAEMRRMRKTEIVCKSPVALEHLHVCWLHGSNSNCSECLKCYRTMLALDLYGKLDESITFDKTKYSLDKVAKMFVDDYYDRRYMEEILDAAYKHGRIDIAHAIERSFRHTQLLKKLLPLSRNVRDVMRNRRFVWRWAYTLENALLAKSIYE